MVFVSLPDPVQAISVQYKCGLVAAKRQHTILDIYETRASFLCRNIYLTVTPLTLVEYELIADEAFSAESAIAHIRREWVE
jgi:hypothetical protein